MFLYIGLAIITVLTSIYWAYKLNMFHKQLVAVGILTLSIPLVWSIQPLLNKAGVTLSEFPVSLAISYYYFTTHIYPLLIVPIISLLIPLFTHKGRIEISSELTQLEKKLGLK